MIENLDKCDCDCHTHSGIMHMVACCSKCPVCEEKIANSAHTRHVTLCKRDHEEQLKDLIYAGLK